MTESLLPIPVILDTDIGDDIDDTWALVMLLRSPELDLRLVTTTYRNTRYRARIVAKLLEIAGRTDVPIGIGPATTDAEGGQADWVADYPLARYPGTIHEDGVGALIDAVMTAPTPPTIISIGPSGNLAEALRREPRIAERARYVGMQGSVYRGYNGVATPAAEWNIKCDIPSAQAVFAAPWPMTITPLDSCDQVRLRGRKYLAVCDGTDPLTRAMMESVAIWSTATRWGYFDCHSTVLFDTVAVYLAFARDLLTMHSVPLRVTDDAFTAVDESGKVVEVATGWRDLAAFEDLLVARLLGPGA